MTAEELIDKIRDGHVVSITNKAGVTKLYEWRKLGDDAEGVIELSELSVKGDTYMVDTIRQTCSCPAFQKGKGPCKHLSAKYEDAAAL